jgi:hypothetical protein
MNNLFLGDVATEEKDEVLDTEVAPDEDKATEDEQTEETSEGDEDAEPEAEETSEVGPFLTLVVDGKEVPIQSKEEVIPLAQKGMHYTQEMQRLREEQRKWEGEREQMAQGLKGQVSQYASALQVLSDTYGAVLGKDQPDWSSKEMQELKEKNPKAYLTTREQWDQLGAIRSELGRVAKERQDEEQKRFQGWVQKEADAVREKRPEWTDPTKRQQDFSLISEYAGQIGITPEEINNLYDHRFWLVLHDAARFRKAEATSKTKVGTVKAKTAEPGRGKGVNTGDRFLRSERERLRETGDERAAGNLLQHMMTQKRK